MRDSVWRALLGRTGDIVASLDALFSEIESTGVPVRRAMVALRTLHPQLVGLGYVWESAKGVVANEHPHGELALPRFRNSPLRELFEGRGPLRYRLDGTEPLPFAVLDELRARKFTDYVGLPLQFSDGRWQALSVATDEPGGFSVEDCAVLTDVALILAPVIEVHETRRVARTMLDTYVGVRAGRKVLEGRVRRGDIELIDAVLVCCDLRGFTALSIDVGPEATVAALNVYFERVCGPIASAGGEILKFIGDGLLAAFPVDDPAQCDKVCRAALEAARHSLADLQAATDVVLPSRHLPLQAGVALHVGQVAFGNIGSRDRLDFTVIGSAVNLASRLAGLCSHLGHALLASSAFKEHVPEDARSLGIHELHGISSPVEVFALGLEP